MALCVGCLGIAGCGNTPGLHPLHSRSTAPTPLMTIKISADVPHRVPLLQDGTYRAVSKRHGEVQVLHLRGSAPGSHALLCYNHRSASSCTKLLRMGEPRLPSLALSIWLVDSSWDGVVSPQVLYHSILVSPSEGERARLSSGVGKL